MCVDKWYIIWFTIKSRGKSLEWQCTVVTVENLVWCMQCLKSSCMTPAMGINYTCQRLYAIFHRQIQWPIWGQHMSLTQTRDQVNHVSLNAHGTTTECTAQILYIFLKEHSIDFMVLFLFVVRHSYHLPKIVWKITDQKSIVRRPNRSDKYPLIIPPVATPTRKNISATFFKYSLSHTKFHSDVQVLPKLSNVSNSHSVHLMRSVLSWTSASFHQLNLRNMLQQFFHSQCKLTLL